MRKFISFIFLILTLSKTRKKWRQTTEWMVQTAHWAALCLVFVCRLEALTCPVWGPAWWWPRSGRAFPSPIPSPNSSRTSGSPPELSAPPLAQGSTWPSVYRWGFPGLFFIIFFLNPWHHILDFYSVLPICANFCSSTSALHGTAGTRLKQLLSFFSAAKSSHRCSKRVQHESELFIPT